MRIGNKPLRRQPKTPQITPRKTHTRNVKLTRNANRNSLQPAVQHINPRLPDRTTNRRACAVVPQFIPVHITYQSAFVDDEGKLQIRDDVYGRDQRLLAILKGADRKVADIAVTPPKGSSTAPVKMPPGTFGGGSMFSGPSFFDRLFGAPEPARPRARVGSNNDRRSTPR